MRTLAERAPKITTRDGTELYDKDAKHYGVDLSETSWRDLGVHPQRNRKEAAAKGVATRERERREKERAEQD